MLRKSLVLLLLLLVASPLGAWNNTGHKVIALIAYLQMTPAARQQVDALLATHPEYSKWTEGVPERERGARALMAASVWPDAIQADPRFHDDNQPATAPIPGLPPGAQARHSGWHFINMPFSTDGTPTVPAAKPSVLTQLQEFQSLGTQPDRVKVYLLPWLIHLIGDVHEPLHTTQWFSKDFPQGDRGGNRVMLSDGQNLHSYWDSRFGSDDGLRFVVELAVAIQARSPIPQELKMDPEQWVNESFALRDKVYSFTGSGTTQNPAVLSADYHVTARSIAIERVALAAYRLAEFLNQTFK